MFFRDYIFKGEEGEKKETGAGSLILERERDAEGSCSEGAWGGRGGIAQECNHGFGVEEGLSWLAKLAGG